MKSSADLIAFVAMLGAITALVIAVIL